MKKKLVIPEFENDEQEAAFWGETDFGGFFGPEDVISDVEFPNLELSTERITLRLPKRMLEGVRQQAKQANIPYQRLIKHYILKGLAAKH